MFSLVTLWFSPHELNCRQMRIHISLPVARAFLVLSLWFWQTLWKLCWDLLNWSGSIHAIGFRTAPPWVLSSDWKCTTPGTLRRTGRCLARPSNSPEIQNSSVSSENDSREKGFDLYIWPENLERLPEFKWDLGTCKKKKKIMIKNKKNTDGPTQYGFIRVIRRPMYRKFCSPICCGLNFLPNSNSLDR